MTVEYGPVVLTAPGGWQEFVSRQPGTIETLKKFHLPRNSDVQLCLFDRGHPVSDNSATAFSDALAAPPHELSEEELRGLQEIIGNLALEGEFETLAARTCDLSESRVLEVRGIWPKLDISSRHIFVSAGDGSTVIEIYFAAPTEEYDSIQELIDSCLQSLQWTQAAVEGEPQDPSVKVG